MSKQRGPFSLKLFGKSEGGGEEKKKVKVVKPPQEFRVVRFSSHGLLDQSMRVIDQYTLGEGRAVQIFVAESGGRGYYFVDEPQLTEEEERALGLILEKLYYTLKPLRDAGVNFPI